MWDFIKDMGEYFELTFIDKMYVLSTEDDMWFSVIVIHNCHFCVFWSIFLKRIRNHFSLCLYVFLSICQSGWLSVHICLYIYDEILLLSLDPLQQRV